MRNIFVVIVLFISSFSFSQDSSNSYRQPDSQTTFKSLENAQQLLDSINAAKTYGDMQQNIDYMLRIQNERKAKQKKQAMLYLGLGIFFLVVLIVGLRRKAKK